ncbi:MAG: YdcF family protein, partial [Acidobacteria bacterium]|nr:YdcF family protein [Acidobacteriota bacterium]
LGWPPDGLCVFGQKAYSTLHEALALRRFLAEHNLRRIIVVTSNLHTRRARTIFHAVLRRHGTQVRFSAAPDVRFPPGRWWEEREARAALFMELVKTVHTWWELRDLPAQAGLPPPASAPEAPPAGTLLPIAPPLPAVD